VKRESYPHNVKRVRYETIEHSFPSRSPIIFRQSLPSRKIITVFWPFHNLISTSLTVLFYMVPRGSRLPQQREVHGRSWTFLWKCTSRFLRWKKKKKRSRNIRFETVHRSGCTFEIRFDWWNRKT